MVRALLDGRKTQTRRVLKVPPTHDFVGIYAPGLTALFNPAGQRHRGNPDDDIGFRLFSLRDRLWVREAFRLPNFDDALPPRMINGGWVYYEATATDLPMGDPPRPAGGEYGRFRQGMHMPRWASRLTLTVTDVRVQRVQEISREDCVAEGYPGFISHDMQDGEMPEEEFQDLWNTLNADRGFGWDANPWVVAYTFTFEQRNIDAA